MRRLLLALLVLLAAALPALARTSIFDVQSRLVQFLLARISTPGSFEVTVERVENPRDGGTRLIGLQVADGAGVWITAGSVTLAWTPRELLRGTLEIPLVEVRDLAILRRPAPGSRPPELKPDGGPAGSPFDWPRSPIALRLGEMRLTNVSVAEGVLPQPIRFDATGAAADEGTLQSLRLDLRRTDAVEGRILLDYARDFAANTLRLALEADEAPGGLVAAAAGLPAESRSRLRLTADGPREAWKVNFAAAADGVLDAAGSATVDYVPPLDIDAALTVVPGPEIGPAWRAVLAPSAEVAVRMEESGGLLRIGALALTSPALTLSGSGSWARATGAMDLGLRLAATGALADLTEGLDFDALRFEGTVRGTPADLAAAGRAELDGLETGPAGAATLLLEVDATRRGERTAFRIDGTATALRLLRLPASETPEAILSADGTLAGGRLDLDRFRLGAPLIDIAARGEVALDLSAGGLTFAVSAPDLAPVAAAWDRAVAGRADLTGRVDLADGRPDLRIVGALRDIANPPADLGLLRFRAHAAAPADGAFDLDLTGTAERLRFGRLGPGLLGTARFGIDTRLRGGRLDIAQADLASPFVTLALTGTAAMDGSALRLGGRLDTPSLGPVAAAYGLPAEGAAALSFRLTGTAAAPQVALAGTLRDVRTAPADLGAFRFAAELGVEAGGAVDFDVSGTAERLRLDRLGPDLLGTARLAAEGRLEGTRLALASASLDAPLLSAAVSGEASTAGGPLALAYRIGTAALGPVAAAWGVPADGSLRAEGTLAGTAAVPELAGTLMLAGARFRGQALGDLALAHDVTLGPEPSGRIDLRGTGSPVGEAGLSAAFRYAAPRLTLEGLSATLSGLRIAGDLAVDMSVPLAEGMLAIDARDLRPLGRLAGLPLAGALRGSLTLAAPGGRQDATLSATGSGLGTDAVAAEGLRIDAGATDLFGQPSLRLTASAQELLAGPLRLNETTVIARGPLSRLAFSVAAKGKANRRRFAFEAEGTAGLAGAPQTVTFSKLEARYAKEKVTQAGPLSLAISGTRISARGLDLRLPRGGRITGDVTLAPGGPTGRLAVADFDLTLLETLAGIEIKGGTLDATADLSGTRGTVAAQLADFRHAAVLDEAGALGADLTASWEGRRAELALILTGEFGEPLRARASLPIRPGGPVPMLDPRGPLDASVDWQGEIGPLWALLPLSDHEVTGAAVIALRIGGTPAVPVPAGTLSLSGGRYQNLEAGVILSDLTVASELAGPEGLRLRLTASDGAQGRVTGTARVVQGGPEAGLDIEVEAVRAVLIRRDDVTAEIDGGVTVTGPLDALAIAGDLRITRAEVRLVDATPPRIVELQPLSWVGEPLPEAGAGTPGGAALDIRVSAPERIYVRGRGLDSEWRLDLTVGGTTDEPRLRGSIERIRGRFDLIGKAFDLREGAIRFDGGPGIDPTISIVLERAQADLTGRIIVSGSAMRPEIAFSSTPALPEDEVLPRLLFGTSRQALTAAQALQLALGLRTLMSGESGPLDVARQTLGIDVLQVDPSLEGDISVTVGKTVAPGVFVGARQELSGDGNTTATVEVEIFPNVKITGEAGPERQRIGIGWERDF